MALSLKMIYFHRLLNERGKDGTYYFQLLFIPQSGTMTDPGHSTQNYERGEGWFSIVPANLQLSPTLQPGAMTILVMAPKL